MTASGGHFRMSKNPVSCRRGSARDFPKEGRSLGGIWDRGGSHLT